MMAVGEDCAVEVLVVVDEEIVSSCAVEVMVDDGIRLVESVVDTRALQ